MGVEITEQVDARKNKIGPDDAVEMAHGASDVFAAKGKKLVHYNLKKDQPTDEELVKIMIGPSGNLRAPTVRVGKKIFVGFHEEELAKLLS